MEKEFVKVTITFNEEQKQKFSNYIKREFKLKDDLKDDEISLYLKALILKLTGEVNFEEELEEIEQRIKNKKEIGDEFVLSELFSKEEWENKSLYKMVLGRLLYNKCKDKSYREEIGIIEDGKNVRKVQKYKKVK